jgi:hypothetical protein
MISDTCLTLKLDRVKLLSSSKSATYLIRNDKRLKMLELTRNTITTGILADNRTKSLRRLIVLAGLLPAFLFPGTFWMAIGALGWYSEAHNPVALMLAVPLIAHVWLVGVLLKRWHKNNPAGY